MLTAFRDGGGQAWSLEDEVARALLLRRRSRWVLGAADRLATWLFKRDVVAMIFAAPAAVSAVVESTAQLRCTASLQQATDGHERGTDAGRAGAGRRQERRPGRGPGRARGAERAALMTWRKSEPTEVQLQPERQFQIVAGKVELLQGERLVYLGERHADDV